MSKYKETTASYISRITEENERLRERLLAPVSGCPTPNWMTEAQAEQIVMAAEVGVFRGTQSELAHALILIAGRRDNSESDNSSSAEKIL